MGVPTTRTNTPGVPRRPRRGHARRRGGPHADGARRCRRRPRGRRRRPSRRRRHAPARRPRRRRARRCPTPTGTPSLVITGMTPNNGTPTGGRRSGRRAPASSRARRSTSVGPRPAARDVNGNRVDAVSPPGLAAVRPEWPRRREPGRRLGTRPAAWLADFDDVPSGHMFHDFVERLVRQLDYGRLRLRGLLRERAPSPARRWRSSSCARGTVRLDAAARRPAAVFADVPAGSFAAAWIEALAAAGITSGCGGGNFCPNRGGDAGADGDPAAEGVRTDLDGRRRRRWSCSPTCRSRILSRPGSRNCSTTGSRPDARRTFYCPDFAVTRGEMAVFLAVTFTLP